MAACGGRECRCSPARMPPSGGGDKRGQGHRMVPLPPLDSPKPSFALTHRRCAAKRGLRGLGSVRRAAFGTLSGPEFTLRKPPRIPVRGQTVQGVCFLLRKAPLRSRVAPWSTKRPCGPLAFRRATEGNRVLRKGRGVKRGRETLVSLPLLPPPPGGGTPHTMSWRITPCPGGPLSPAAASRRNGGTAHPLLRVKAMGRKVASTGCAAVSAQGPPSADGKKTARPPERRQVSPLCRGENLFYFPS